MLKRFLREFVSVADDKVQSEPCIQSGASMRAFGAVPHT